jgi:hypothetical protein
MVGAGNGVRSFALVGCRGNSPFMTPRILTLDIETKPIKGYVWGIWEQNLSLDMIEEDWSILCYCAKWLDEPKVISDYTGGRGKAKVKDDRKLCLSLHALLDEADLVIAQNGKKFDLKKIDSRMYQHNINPYSPVRVIDTLVNSRSRFSHTSNKLEWQSKISGGTQKSKHKQFPGAELWLECMKDNPKAWKEMLAYCATDVIATEHVYIRQRPWIRKHPNIGAYIEDKDPRCTTCGSKHLQSRGSETTQQGKYARYHCQDCGAWPRGKLQQLAHNVRKNLLVGA